MNLFTNLEIIIMVSVIGFLSFIVILLSIIELVSKHSHKNEIDTKTVETEIMDTLKEEVNSKNVEEDDIHLENIDITKKIPVINQPEKPEITSLEVTKEIADLKASLFEEPEDKVEDLKVQENVSYEEDDLLIEDIDTPSFSNTTLNQDIPDVPRTNSIEFLELEPKEKAKIELEKIEKTLEEPMSLEDTINSLEAMEEENAVISYQELLSATQELSIANLEEEGNEPISINQVFEQFNIDEVNPNAETVSPLAKGEVPEPDFMVTSYAPNNLENENLNEIQLENTANLEKLDKEIRKTNKFLHILNELKKNLD